LSRRRPLAFHHDKNHKILILLAILVCVLTASPGRSEHEIYYRFIVLGYLEDAPGKPRSDVSVQLTREKTGFSYMGTTDASGLYVLVARLGDESVGERLHLRAGADSVTITARFDPADHLRERGTRVDFVGGRPVERPAAFASTLRRFLEN
jgi:hypothetical protein